MFVYILYSQKFERFYVGITSDLDSRLKAHNSGHVKSTKPYIPWVYVYTEEKSDRMEARQREKYLKSAAGRRWRKIILGM
jgi:putative endonuclease